MIGSGCDDSPRDQCHTEGAVSGLGSVSGGGVCEGGGMGRGGVCEGGAVGWGL